MIFNFPKKIVLSLLSSSIIYTNIIPFSLISSSSVLNISGSSDTGSPTIYFHDLRVTLLVYSFASPINLPLLYPHLFQNLHSISFTPTMLSSPHIYSKSPPKSSQLFETPFRKLTFLSQVINDISQNSDDNDLNVK